MELYPTRPTFQVAVAAAGLLTVGTAARLAPVALFGGAMLVAIAIGRALALVGVARLRSGGFEMIWADKTRIRSGARDAPIVLACELVNRSRQGVRVNGIRVTASSMLAASVQPQQVDLAPRARARLELTVRGHRVGRWGIHGLSLRVGAVSLGAEALYEVPLVFASPFGVAVTPRPLTSFLGSPRGGRSRRASDADRSGRRFGQGDEVRELRDHVPGDPLKRVAWKASARRGRLLVREMDRDERDVVWLVVDASIELWAGAQGRAPLDRAVDDAATSAVRLLRRGDRVGLVVAASRVRTWLAPDGGTAQGTLVAEALASASSAVDADRSALDEMDVAQLVVEHLRPLSGDAMSSHESLDALAARAEMARPRAPFAAALPFAATARERTLRHYLTCFGIESPPRAAGEHEASARTVAGAIERIAAGKPRPSVVHVWAPAPTDPKVFGKALSALRRRHVELRWTLPSFEGALAGSPNDDAVAVIASEAAEWRARGARTAGERALRRLGVRVVSAGVGHP
jgi:uncharacterized protein (DUF58 family)